MDLLKSWNHWTWIKFEFNLNLNLIQVGLDLNLKMQTLPSEVAVWSVLELQTYSGGEIVYLGAVS